jgi:two-component system OmpR family response regulator
MLRISSSCKRRPDPEPRLPTAGGATSGAAAARAYNGVGGGRRLRPKKDRPVRVLIIEDDAENARFVVRGLREAGCTADHAATGVDGVFLASQGDYDVLVVDRILPGMDGLSLVRMLRESGVETPILFLTAVGGLGDRVEGLEVGGDDYLTKPFAFSELHARLRALVRRNPRIAAETVLRVADLTLDRLTRKVERAGRPIELQPREYRLLDYLMEHAGEVVTRTMLLEKVWEFHFEPKTSVVESHVSRLRAKIDKPFDIELIRTVRGAGYVLSSPSR